MRHMAVALKIEDLSRAHDTVRRQAVEQGLPVEMLRTLLADGVITLAHLARVVGPRRTLERRLKLGERLTVEESDRLARFMHILDVATHTFGDKAEAVEWLAGPKRAFDGAAPMDLVRTSVGAQEVENFFIRAAHGMLA